MVITFLLLLFLHAFAFFLSLFFVYGNFFSVFHKRISTVFYSVIFTIFSLFISFSFYENIVLDVFYFPIFLFILLILSYSDILEKKLSLIILLLFYCLGFHNVFQSFSLKFACLKIAVSFGIVCIFLLVKKIGKKNRQIIGLGDGITIAALSLLMRPIDCIGAIGLGSWIGACGGILLGVIRKKRIKVVPFIPFLLLGIEIWLGFISKSFI